MPSTWHRGAEIEEIILPEEVWINIWSYLDFNTVQKICTRVKKSWLEMIRNSKRSWEMKIRRHADMLEVRIFDGILSHWMELRVIHFKIEPDFARFGLILKAHRSLEKIVILSGPGLYTIGSHHSRTPSLHYLDPTPWGSVSKYWIDPQHCLTPKDTVKNVIKLRIPFKNMPEEFAMMQNDCDFTNLETLEICGTLAGRMSYENAVPNTEMLFKFKNLKKLEIHQLTIHINILLDILRLLGNFENGKMSVILKVTSAQHEETTKGIFNQAFELVKEIFPYPDMRIQDLNIFEGRVYWGQNPYHHYWFTRVHKRP